MSTQAAVILAAAILAAALIVVFAPGEEARAPGTPSSRSSTAPEPGAATREPSLDVPSGNEDVGRLMRELADAKARIAELEKRGPGADGGGETSPDGPQIYAKKRADVMALVKAYATGTATREQVGALMRLAKDKALMGRIVASLQDTIAADPEDLAARLQLAEVESARVHGAESITERAQLAGNVREQLAEILKRDPENWDARYMRAVGISHSQRTPQGRATAIREFEALIAMQEARSAEPRFAETYGELAKVYVAEKDLASARAALENGLARFPDAKALREQLEALGK